SRQHQFTSFTVGGAQLPDLRAPDHVLRMNCMTRNDAPTMNPLVLQRADPCVLRHGDEYFFTASHPEYARIILRRAAHLDDLQSAEVVTIWLRHEVGPQSHLIWAPEIHHIDDAWYIYYAAAPNEKATIDEHGPHDTVNHRMHVLESS